MFSIESINEDEIISRQYKKHYNNNSHVVKSDSKIVAYVTFTMKNKSVMWLDMIEVIPKEKKLGTKIIKFFFQHFSLEKIEGFILCENRAYRFWNSLGAEIYYIHEEEYEIEELIDAGLESPFTLCLNR